MDVHTLEALSDNYMYLIVCRRTKQAACVDPADAATVVAAARRLGATITTVLTTHHHFDHAGGNNEMKKQIPGISVVGGERDNVQGKTRSVADGETDRFSDAGDEADGGAPAPARVIPLDEITKVVKFDPARQGHRAGERPHRAQGQAAAQSDTRRDKQPLLAPPRRGPREHRL